MKLTTKKIQAATPSSKWRTLLSDGGGLYLQIAPGGSKSWLVRFTFQGKRCTIGKGGYPAVSLSNARIRAARIKVQVAEGIDPLAVKREEKTANEIPTFAEAAERTIEAHRHNWRGPKTEAGWRQSLSRHVLPKIGDTRLDEIGQADVLKTPCAYMDGQTGDCQKDAPPYSGCAVVGAIS